MSGEHLVPIIAQFVALGSSPRERGALFAGDEVPEGAGIIPA